MEYHDGGYTFRKSMEDSFGRSSVGKKDTLYPELFSISEEQNIVSYMIEEVPYTINCIR